MNGSDNPYASPQSLSSATDGIVVDHAFVPAGQGARFVNSIIDNIAQWVIEFGFGLVVVVVWGAKGDIFLNETGWIFSIPVFFAYYIVLEATTSRTFGKWITGTKVVSEDGGLPTLGQIVGRTFARLIPFEAFSFFGTPTRGWHDRLPRTYVVKAR